MSEINCKFSFKQRVKVTKGFYKGFIGHILEVEQNKNNDIVYKVKLESENEKIKVLESDLQRSFKLF